jgi:hypothetical protein
MTLPELIMSSTILTWIVLSTVYRIRMTKKMMKEFEKLQKSIEELKSKKHDDDEWIVTWTAGVEDGKDK